MDKARRTYVVPLSFSDGEVPPAAKLTALSSQARRGLQVLERIVGDPWNQSGDPVLSPGADPSLNALHIPNLARAIGDLALLNPRAFLPSTMGSYTDAIGARYPNQHIAYLRYIPAQALVGANFVWAGDGGSRVAGTFQTNLENVDAAGEWSVDVQGKVYSYDPIPSTATIEYDPLTAVSPPLASGTWNVIPDPSTWAGSFAGLKITYTNGVDGTGGYTLHLPPRMPLGSSRATAMAPSSATENLDDTPNAGAFVAFQDSTAAASTRSHYRYQLPDALVGTLAAGTVLPEGFLYLWDETNGTIVEGTTFDVAGSSNSFRVDVTGTELTNLFGGLISAGGHVSEAADESAAAYRSRWKLIVHGTSLAQHVDSITAQFLDHQHRGGDSPPIRHGDLEELVTPNSGNSRYPTGVASFQPQSRWTNDHHGQYLHRTGSTGDATTRRDYLDNAMTGDLLMSAAVDGGAGWLNNTQSSRAIVFGQNTGIPPRIRWRGGTLLPDLRALEIDAGNLDGGTVALTRGRLAFEITPGTLDALPTRRGQFHYDNLRVFKLSSDAVGNTTISIGNSILAVGTIRILPESTTTVRSGGEDDSTTGSNPRLTLRGSSAGVMEVTTRNADLLLDVPSGQQLHIFTGSSLSALTSSSEDDIFIRSNADDVVIEAGHEIFLRAGTGTWASGVQTVLPGKDDEADANLSFSVEDDFRVRTGDNIVFEYEGTAGTFGRFDSSDMAQLVGQGFAIDPDETTSHLHRHNIWRHAGAASLSYNFIGGVSALIIFTVLASDGMTLELTYTFSTGALTLTGGTEPNPITITSTTVNTNNQTTAFDRVPFIQWSMTNENTSGVSGVNTYRVLSHSVTTTAAVVTLLAQAVEAVTVSLGLLALGPSASTTASPGV